MKLGRTERAILEKLRSQDGLTSREEALAAAYPDVGDRPSGDVAVSAWTQRRDRAEASTTRAVQSLERKGLVVVERNPRSGRTLLRSADLVALPTWEEIARAEEDLAAHCRRVATAWNELSSRAAARAVRVRMERSEGSTEGERTKDLAEVDRLESGKDR